MSADLVKRWRRVAKKWRDCGNDGLERQRDGIAVEREFAYARIFEECADSLERSLAIQARKRGALRARRRKGASR